GADGLQQIVDCLDFEGLRREIAVGGNKHDGRRVVQAFKQVEAVVARQQDVKKQGVGAVLVDDSARLVDGGGFAFDLDVGGGFEQAAHIPPGGCFVVDDDYAQHRSPF